MINDLPWMKIVAIVKNLPIFERREIYFSGTPCLRTGAWEVVGFQASTFSLFDTFFSLFGFLVSLSESENFRV